MVVVSDTKDRFGPCEVENWEVLRLMLGEDCGRPCAVFQELQDSSNGGAIDCVRARLCVSGRVLLWIEIESNGVRFGRRLAISDR